MSVSHVRVGAGPRKVIALHGWFGTAATGWGDLPDLINPDRYDYAFMDCRGYGQRQDEKGEYTMGEIAADALALADELGWASFSAVGHSMGGMAVQRLYADAPRRVERLVGISPVPAGGVPFDEAGWELFHGAAEYPANRRQIIDFTTGGRLSGHWLDRMVSASLENTDSEAFAAYLPAWAKTDFVAEIEGARIPVLAIVGEHDPALGLAAIEQTWQRHYPRAAVKVLANAGHYAMFETPVRLATLLEEFLD